MNSVTLAAFGNEIKLATAEVVPASGTTAISAEDYRPSTLRHRIKKSDYERMDREGWKQTARDLPVVILGTGLGYGVGRTIAEEIGKRVGKSVQPPGWLRHLPAITATASSLASYSLGRSRKRMAERREEARKVKR